MRAREYAAVLLAVSLSLAGCQSRERFPSRPILLICPWSAGGGTDQVARQVAILLEAELGVPVNVVNATGGAGVTGHTRGALAPPDGYTLTLITVELNMLHWRGLTNISRESFEPVMMLNRDDAALIVRNDSPWRTLADLEQAIKAEPGRLKASGTAQGGIWHIALAGWLDSLGLATDDVNWISINGASPSLQELLSGGVDLVCCSLPEAQTLLEAGEVRGLGVMAAQRARAFPDVPTFREQGFDWLSGGWRGLALPRGVSRERFEILVDAVRKVAASDALLGFMSSNGFNLAIAGPEEFRAYLATDDARFGEILNSQAFRPVRASRYGPYVFPVALIVSLIAVFLFLLFRGHLKRLDSATPLNRTGMLRITLAFALIAVLIAVMDDAGYIIAAFTLLLVMQLALRVRWPVALGVALVLSCLSYQVFAVGLRVPLPWGWLGW
jgi:tripartite-type tricarboxylate transporter receptor subunit TctC